MSPTPLAYTVSEVAEALRVSERTIRRAIAAGQLQSIRVGRCVRVPAESIQQFVSSAASMAHASRRSPSGRHPDCSLSEALGRSDSRGAQGWKGVADSAECG
jgi:excisionase family DNA binding protein